MSALNNFLPLSEVVNKPVWNFRYSFPNLFMRTFMYGMVGSLAMFLTSWEKADRVKDQFLDKNRDFGETFDFIVVGGGTSGSILANRLSEKYKVLLLEAGGEPHPFQAIPFMSNFMSGYPEVDWMHITMPQKDGVLGAIDNRAMISGGKGLGGTNNLDNMLYLRGSPQDYDNWAKSTGDESWSFNKVMPFFMAHENYEGPWKGKHKKKMFGDKGEMRLAMAPFSKLAKRYVVAGNEMGYPYADLNSDFGEGFDMPLSPVKMGSRVGVYNSFLRHPKWNLLVQKYSTVKRVLFQGEDNSAYGVEYNRHGTDRTAFARKEVILCAGAINTPKILMHSGIGDYKHLQSVGISPRVHLPDVGLNLQDHVGVRLGPFFTNKGETLLMDRDVSLGSFLSFPTGTGPLTTTGYEGVAFLSSSSSSSQREHKHWPDVMLTMYGLAIHDTAEEDFCHQKRFRRDIVGDYFQGAKGKDSFSIIVSTARPKSRGSIRLTSSNPLSPAEIDPKYLSEISDVGVLVDGIKKAMRMVENTLTFREIGARFTEKSVKGCNQFKFKSDEYWACYARVLSFSMGDVVGTAAMGKVLDTQLNVKGTSRLRVADASVMPTIVSGGTSAATMMIGEKAASMILTLWGNPNRTEELSKDRETVNKIMGQTKEKLGAYDASTIFYNSIKDTPTYQSLSENDLKAAGTSNPEHAQGGSLLTPSGWANIFRPFHSSFMNWSDLNGIRLLDPNKQKQRVNPFSLIGAMFRNSLTKAGQNEKTPENLGLNQFNDNTKQPFNIFNGNSGVTLTQAEGASGSFSNRPVGSVQPSSFNVEPVATLFGEQEVRLSPINSLQPPFILTPKEVLAPTSPPINLQPVTKASLSSSVDSYLSAYSSHKNSGGVFSQTIPIIGLNPPLPEKPAEVKQYTLDVSKYLPSQIAQQRSTRAQIQMDGLTTEKYLPNIDGHVTSPTVQGNPLLFRNLPRYSDKYILNVGKYLPAETQTQAETVLPITSSKIRAAATNRLINPLQMATRVLSPIGAFVRGIADFSTPPTKPTQTEAPAPVNFKLTITPSPSLTKYIQVGVKPPTKSAEKVENAEPIVPFPNENMASIGVFVPSAERSTSLIPGILTDEKFLSEEVEKLLSKSYVRANGITPPQSYEPNRQAKENIPFTRLLNEMVEKHKMFKHLQPEESYNGEETIQGREKGDDGFSNGNNDNMSFTIKILNQKP